MIKVLMVCMGNICRSPTAEGVFRAQVEKAGLTQQIHIDSAGTHDYHIGAPPDNRAQTTAAKRGYDLSRLRGRQVSQRDFVEFDYILAMDDDNLARMQAICPAQHAHKVSLFLDYSEKFTEREVPDPYYGGGSGFEKVLDMVEDASQGLLAHLQREHKLK